MIVRKVNLKNQLNLLKNFNLLRNSSFIRILFAILSIIHWSNLRNNIKRKTINYEWRQLKKTLRIDLTISRKFMIKRTIRSLKSYWLNRKKLFKSFQELMNQMLITSMNNLNIMRTIIIRKMKTLYRISI